MVNGPQISLKNIFLSFGEKQIFEGLNLLVQPRDRIALVGRNGSGKSTLLKVLQGLVLQDEGERILSKGVSVGYMEQDPNLSEFATLKDYVCSEILVNDYHLGEKVAQNLGIDLDHYSQIEIGYFRFDLNQWNLNYNRN